jgi:hypothetical protein
MPDFFLQFVCFTRGFCYILYGLEQLRKIIISLSTVFEIFPRSD